MKKSYFSGDIFGLGLLLSAIALLPGCGISEWFKEKMGLTSKESSMMASADGSEVLATINGKPALTAKKFEADYKNFIEKHPMGQLLAAMPGAQEKIFEGLLTQQLINEWAQDKKIESTDEYKESMKQLQQWVNTSQFEKTLSMKKLSDAELKKFYSEHKELFSDMIIACEIDAVGLSFKDEKSAKEFLEKTQSKPAEFEKVAEAKGLKGSIKSFKVPNQTSGIDSALQERILLLQKFPSVELIKLPSNTCWVVKAKSKKDQETRPAFEEVKAVVEQRAMQEEKTKVYEKAIEELKKKYNLVINKDYFTKQMQQKQTMVFQQPQGDVQELNEGQVDIMLPEKPVDTKTL